MALPALKLHKTKPPTVFNDNFGLGMTAGVLLTTLLPALNIFLAVPVGILGGLIGKNIMQKESQHGKIVKEPSLVNKHALLGGLNAALLVTGLAKIEFMSWLAPVAVPVAIAAGVIGLIHGAKVGKKEQTMEYNMALQEQQAMQISRSRERSHEINHGIAEDRAPARFAEKETARRQMTPEHENALPAHR